MRDIEKDTIYLAILNIIYKLGEAYPDEIAAKMVMSRQAIDYRLKRLLELGYIEKKYNRKVYYIITSKGKKLVEAKPKSHSKYIKIKLYESDKKYFNLVKYIPILGFSMGIITWGQFIAQGDPYRGFIGFVSWMIIGILGYYLVKNKILKKI